MPDFLLCNSKLTFQLTMTPEKTNFMTQGADGQKRLKQGPDLASYRGLSVIHSRAFSLETGQEARDILRRRVRTAEYYRIPPHRDNYKREFELYSESRDTWFSMNFQDLEEFSRFNPDNEEIQSLVADIAIPALGWGMTLGAVPAEDIVSVNSKTLDFAAEMKTPLRYLFSTGGDRPRTLFHSTDAKGFDVEWTVLAFPGLLGVSLEAPHKVPVYSNVQMTLEHALGIDPAAAAGCIFPLTWGKLLSKADVFNRKLMSPFRQAETEIACSTSEWFAAFAFYMEVLGRTGVPMNLVSFDVDMFEAAVAKESPSNVENTLVSYLMSLERRTAVRENVSDFYLAPRGIKSVNHELHFFNAESKNISLERAVCKNRLGGIVARSLIITGEMLAVLGVKSKDTGNLVAEDLASVDWETLTDDAKGFFQTLLEWFRDNTDSQRIVGTLANKDSLKNLFGNLPDPKFHARDDRELTAGCMNLLMSGEYSTFPMGITTRTHLLHPTFEMDIRIRNKLLAALKENDILNSTCGFLNYEFLDVFVTALKDASHGEAVNHPFMDRIAKHGLPDEVVALTNLGEHWDAFVSCLSDRITGDGITNRSEMLKAVHLKDKVGMVIADCDSGCKAYTLLRRPSDTYKEYVNNPRSAVSRMFVTPYPVDLGVFVSAGDQVSGYDGTYHAPPRTSTGMHGTSDEALAANTEFVIIRPNIEHNMLGIILGLAGSELGHTFWGQTELSCYDDSMHGIWGMSYKYHERAIVFNEKNLVRLWDIAYDGYNGGKDDTHVDWYEPGSKNGYKKFGEATMDLGSSYRGPSMMVMKFTHTDAQRREPGSGYLRNWPSPIVFHEPEEADDGGRRGASLSVDQENLHVVDVDDFRVFHEKLYKKQYGVYRAMMPHFQDNHRTRKSAGEASAESETQSTCLAFQGSMRIKEGGKLIQEIQGSGHHGPDYVGVASVRAGKGIKYNGQAPTFSHMV